MTVPHDPHDDDDGPSSEKNTELLRFRQNLRMMVAGLIDNAKIGIDQLILNLQLPINVVDFNHVVDFNLTGTTDSFGFSIRIKNGY